MLAHADAMASIERAYFSAATASASSRPAPCCSRFTSATAQPWLPLNPNYLQGVNVEQQMEAADSHLQVRGV